MSYHFGTFGSVTLIAHRDSRDGTEPSEPRRFSRQQAKPTRLSGDAEKQLSATTLNQPHDAVVKYN
jgi:hypothetical protein